MNTMARRVVISAAILSSVLASAGASSAHAQASSCATTGQQVTCVFDYTGAAQIWSVPTGVTQATFDVFGAAGAGGEASVPPGEGGEATATIPLTTSVYQINVGAVGLRGMSTNNFGGGAPGDAGGGGGGGASDVRTGGFSLGERIIVAGGGGGGQEECESSNLQADGMGGDGGGLSGVSGQNCANPEFIGSGAGAGTQQAGGVGGRTCGACAPSSGVLGAGGAGVSSGGGGGGGYYGGGGANSAGGGGGSGFGPANTVFHTGVKTGAGRVTVTYTLPDTTPPVTSIGLTPANPGGRNGWYISSAMAIVSATDPDDTSSTLQTRCVLDPPTPPTSFASLPSGTCAYAGTGASVSAGGKHTLYAASEDPAGNTDATVVSASFNIDTAPPTASPTQSPPPASSGWNTSDVSVNWNWTDNTAGSGMDPTNCTTSSLSSGEGMLVLQATCSDAAGNAGSATYTVNVDKTAPTLTAAPATQPNRNGWYNANVTVHFTCTDALSGIAPATCPADQVLSTDGSAVSSTAQTVNDGAGNTSAPSNVVTLAIDKTAPVVTVVGVADKATYPLGNVPRASCNTTDALSGVATPASPQVTGGTASGVGTFTATCSGATDKAGNAAPTVSATYTVAYKFSGYLAPVNDPPIVNTGNAGRTYPVKFQLTNTSGGFISALAAVTSISYQSTSCGAFSNDPTDALEAETSGSSGLRYDSTANQYVYTWATPSAAGCYTLFLTLDSGQVFPAYFKLS